MQTKLLAGGLLAALLALPSAADASYTAHIEAGTLRLAGDGASDAVRLDQSGATLVVDVGVDGTADFTFEKATFAAVNLTAGAGDDQVSLGSAAANDKLVTVDGGAGNDTIAGGAGPETLIGGTGDDVIDGNLGADVALLGSGSDRFNWDPGDSSDTVEGGSGNDVLDFNGANIGELYDVSANGDRVRFTRNIAAIAMDLDGMERIALRTLGGADAVSVNDTTGTDLRTVEVDQAAVDGTGDAQIDSVTVHGTPGDDAFDAAAIAGGIRLTGPGADVSVVGGETDRDTAGFDGGDGDDALTYRGTPDDDLIATTANGLAVRVDAPGATPVETIAVERLVLAAGGGADTFGATGNLAPLTNITMDGGAGDDTIRGGNGADTLLGGSGNDLLDGNQGTDTALLGSGSDHFTWDPGDGNDTVEGGTGTDTLDFNGSNIGELLDVSANGDRTRLTRNIANITLDLGDTEQLALRTLGGADTITVNDLGGTDTKTVDVDLAASTGLGDEQADTVIANGTAAADVVKVTRADAQVLSKGLFALTRISGAEPALDVLRVNTLDGDDTVTVAPDVSMLMATAVDLGADG